MTSNMPRTIPLDELKLGQAVKEIVEDNVHDIVRHYQDVRVVTEKSKITLEITMLPDDQRIGYQIEIKASQKRAGRKGFSSTVYARTDAEGRVILSEYDPSQLRFLDRSGD
jgi:hypothetical protein